jgi:UDP-N-acetylglucosamine 1-carboxyvinyltransferase
MDCYRITGGVALRGRVAVSGSKNAALPIMAAALLADGPVRLLGAPRVADVFTLGRVLERLGMHVTAGPDWLALRTVDPSRIRAEERLVRRMRASFCVLGPLVARRGRAVVALPGGCNLGDRPVDLHLRGLAALGADIRLEHGYVVARAERLRGAAIDLAGPRGPTVTGTANVLSAAVLARGKTVIRGAAREPEIVELGRFLVALGARVGGLGTETIEVEGVERLGGGVSWRVMPDRIEAATLLLAAAVTRGETTLTGVVPEHLGAVLAALRRMGCDVDAGEDRVTLTADRRPLRPIDVTAEPYPAVPTDLQPLWTALLATVEGESRVADAVFPGRFRHVGELRRLGATIRLGATAGLSSSAATIVGSARLDGAAVEAADLRGGAALVLAGLAARGETVVRGAHHLDRGYERLDGKLRALGASIERFSLPAHRPDRPRVRGCSAST